MGHLGGGSYCVSCMQSGDRATRVCQSNFLAFSEVASPDGSQRYPREDGMRDLSRGAGAARMPPADLPADCGVGFFSSTALRAHSETVSDPFVGVSQPAIYA